MVIVGSLMGSGLADEVMHGTASVECLGIGIAMLCALFYAMYMHFNSLVELEYPPLLRTFVQIVGAAAAGLLITPFMTDQPLTLALAPYGFIMGLVMTVAPCVCLAAASAKLPGSLIAVLSASELPMAVLTGVVVLGETLTPLRGIGAAIICAAIAASNLSGEAENAV